MQPNNHNIYIYMCVCVCASFGSKTWNNYKSFFLKTWFVQFYKKKPSPPKNDIKVFLWRPLLFLHFLKNQKSIKYEAHTISFQTFFVREISLIVHTWNSSPLRSNLLRLLCTCCTVPTTFGSPHGSPLVWPCQWPSSQPLSSPQLSHTDSLWAKGITKSHREQSLDYRDGEKLSWCPSWSNSLWQVVDWFIVLVEIPLTELERCWPLPTESHSELP